MTSCIVSCDMAGGYSVTCCKTTHLSAKQNIVITMQVVDSVSAVVTREDISVILGHVISVKFYPLTSIFILQWALSSEQCKLVSTFHILYYQQ